MSLRVINGDEQSKEASELLERILQQPAAIPTVMLVRRQRLHIYKPIDKPYEYYLLRQIRDC
jgi:hypothetical protein